MFDEVGKWEGITMLYINVGLKCGKYNGKMLCKIEQTTKGLYN